MNLLNLKFHKTEKMWTILIESCIIIIPLTYISDNYHLNLLLSLNDKNHILNMVH